MPGLAPSGSWATFVFVKAEGREQLNCPEAYLGGNCSMGSLSSPRRVVCVNAIEGPVTVHRYSGKQSKRSIDSVSEPDQEV